MRIAIQAADLDHDRIDGTRVYIFECLKYFGRIDSETEFLIYHKKEFNPELRPPEFPNYKIFKKSWPFFWTQMRLAKSLYSEKPDALWMPMHNIPLIRHKNIKTIVTIHDLAFKYFPETFTRKDFLKISLLTSLAVTRSDKIITISESSKKDILRFYPKTSPEKIKVIYHGFNGDIFQKERNMDLEISIRKEFGIGDGPYILYVGAIQPRKNLKILVEAFEKIKEDEKCKNLKLVLAGEKAWLFGDILARIEKSPWEKDIILPGKIKYSDIGHLMRGAEIFCFPSLYEGFGIPILEAFAAGVPVVCSDNSSLPEVGGEAALYFDGKDFQDLSKKIKKILTEDTLRKEMIEKGYEQIKKFSWEKCAKETLEYIKNYPTG